VTTRILSAALAIALATSSSALAENKKGLASAEIAKRVGIDQRLNEQVPLHLQFRDSSGKMKRLDQIVDGTRPVIVTLGYYECPMLCNVTLDALTNIMSDTGLEVGKDFEVVTVSFDPKETPVQAAKKKELYMSRLSKRIPRDAWHFMTGSEQNVTQLARSLGFRYEYDPNIQQYAHAAAVMVLTPQGKISRYFYGFEYNKRDLRLGLVEASENRIGTPTDKFMLLCYDYDPATGRYSARAMAVVRAGGAATVFALAGFVFVLVRQERKKVVERDPL
jgi:protein SCO1